jgi:hypothetical protein
MKYLLVGGPRHGDFVNVDETRRSPLFVPDYPPFPTASFDAGDPKNWPTISTVEYDRMDIGTDRIVYVARRQRS